MVDPAVRFWSKVDRRAPDECWPWRGTRNGNGYGQFVLAGRRRPAHQVAWELAHGRPFPGQHTLHSCDVPLCVNPAHLSPGTAADNSADKVSKGRQYRPVGSLHPQARIDEDSARRIRGLCDAGVPQRVIAARFGLHQSAVSRIASRSTWRHVA